MNHRGEPTDLDLVFIEHQQSLRRLAGRLGANRDQVDDITAEVWACAARAYRAGRASEVTAGWLVTVTKRRLVDHWRRSGAERRRFERLTSEPSPASVSIFDELLETDRSMLDTVSAEAGTLLWLRHVEGWSVIDIADWLDVSYLAAESRLARARRDLRTRHLAEAGR